MTDTINLLDDTAPVSQNLGEVSTLAKQLSEVEKRIAELEFKLKEYKILRTKISEVDLPEIMQELNLKNFTLDDGTKVTVTDFISASLPSGTAILKARGAEREALVERKSAGLDWLRENGGADLVKNNVSVAFGKNEDADCEKFVEQLNSQNLFYKRSTEVHAGTLKAFIKESLSLGKNVPQDTFKIYNGRRADIKKGSI